MEGRNPKLVGIGFKLLTIRTLREKHGNVVLEISTDCTNSLPLGGKTLALFALDLRGLLDNPEYS